LISQAAGASLGSTLNMVYLGVFPTALAFTTWAYALARTSAGKMGATTYVVPALVVLMSWAALREVPAALTLAGGLVCLAGVAVARQGPRRGATGPEAEEAEAAAAQAGGPSAADPVRAGKEPVR
jgi:drug/metabolite transporter (DMT)-like permease